MVGVHHHTPHSLLALRPINGKFLAILVAQRNYIFYSHIYDKSHYEFNK